MKNSNKKIVLILTLTAAVFVTVFYYTDQQKKGFRVVFLSVGQGDSVFIESPTGVQMLIDGGPDKKVLRELGKVMSFFDRSIDVVLATHPDSDHVGGLPDVLGRYKVDYFIRTENERETSAYNELKRVVDEKSMKSFIARKGIKINLGSGVVFEVLFPDRDVSLLESNTSSIVGKLSYGNIDFLLTGDSPKAIENYLVATVGAGLESDILKAGHHGSKTSTSEEFLKTVTPKLVIVSAGKDNRYGHPHKEVLDILDRFNIPFLNTANEGSIRCDSDGLTFSCK